MRGRILRRTALFALVLPFLYIGTASATFLYRFHKDNTARGGARLPALPAPERGQRLLVFAPHIDDETLGCGGLLQQAVRAGASARVVFLTNGDGFRVAVERQFRRLHPTPGDYVRFAAIRQEEAVQALAGLGVHADSVEFLGYPDRGLLPLWEEHWSPDRLFTSAYTRCDRSPYKRAFRPEAPYCGSGLLEDLATVLQQARPTDVYVTHPSDDHPDHSAASAFVTLAVRRLQRQGAAWARGCRLHYYLVHRGDWPAPQGLHRNDQLLPPSEMTGLDTRWALRPLTGQEVEAKEASILAYPSQTAVMKRFLVSFARSNELFGRIPTAAVPRVEDAESPRAARPVILDPVDDNLLRNFQGGADVQAVHACRDAGRLLVRVGTSQPPSRRVRVRLRVRYFGDPALHEAGGVYSCTLRPSADNPAAPLEAVIPLRDIGYAREVALNVETSFAGLPVDRTGYRFLSL